MENQEKIKSVKSELLELEAKDTSQLFKKAKSNIVGGIGIFLIGCFITGSGINLDNATFPIIVGTGLIIWGIIGLIAGSGKNADAEKTKLEVEARILNIKKELIELE